MHLVGTSGWQHRDWRDDFYPAATRVRLWLESYASRFRTVEVNAAFYRLPDWGYLRMHGETYTYVNNDPGAAAPRDAETYRQLLGAEASRP